MLSNSNLCRGEIRSNISYEDFAKVYKVFSNAPFFEAWTPELIKSQYNSFNVKDGTIFGYYLDNECVGILTLRPLIPGDHPVRFPNSIKTMYLSDIATISNYRGMGIGTQLLLHGLRHAKVLGYDTIYLRTKDKSSSMSYSMAKKCGFTEIWDICQEVEFPRTRSDIPSKDLRFFMVREL